MPELDRSARPITILMADDDQDDREMALDALQDLRLADKMQFVVDGQDLLDYLRREGGYADADERAESPLPGIILLDLNMPKKDGREALAEIKSDQSLRQIPVVVMTTSNDEEDVRDTYALGANSFITKPVTLSGLVDVMRTLAGYWFDTVELPGALGN
jgi:CheY-like chemotaxis protein